VKVKRGDVVLLSMPFAQGGGSKIRPAVVVQNDRKSVFGNYRKRQFPAVVGTPSQRFSHKKRHQGRLPGTNLLAIR
jgi:hypothetical protein